MSIEVTKHFTPGTYGFFWYQHYYYCSECQKWIPHEHPRIRRDSRGLPRCPFCNYGLRSKPKGSVARRRFRENFHNERIDVK